jgi:hypothetical protein
MGMSATATDYTYALYNGQAFLLVGNILDRHVIILHMHVHEEDEL